LAGKCNGHAPSVRPSLNPNRSKMTCESLGHLNRLTAFTAFVSSAVIITIAFDIKGLSSQDIQDKLCRNSTWVILRKFFEERVK
jgi:hypothetical protein